MLIISKFLLHYKDHPVVESIFLGIRPAVVALIAVPTFNLAKSAKISLANCWIPICGALAIWALGVNPIYVLLIAAGAGFIYGIFISDESTVKPKL